jgi:hypothetical protein
MTMPGEMNAVARGVLESSHGGTIVLSVPQTDYRIHLAANGVVSTPIGKRINGTIEARALRMFKAAAGGQFIEPVNGAPRIVAGTVMRVDPAGRRVLVNAVVPMWMHLAPEQPEGAFQPGDMVNCYVQSGTNFTLA